MDKKQMRAYNGLVRGGKILVFAAVMTIFCFIGLLWFARPKTSVVEKRNLTAFPSLTWEGFWSGDYFGQISTWYADTYPTREALISANQSLQSHYGIRGEQIVGNANMVADEIPEFENDAGPSTPAETVPATPAPAEPSPSPSPSAEPEQLEDGTVSDIGEFAGSIYITDHAGYGLYYFSQSGADAFAQTMNQVYANVGDKVNLYTMIVPISAGVMLDEAVLEDMGCSDEKKALEYLYSRLDPGIHTVSVFDALRQHNSEYIYFHTDHHWTALGAYYAYREFCKEKGVEPHDISEYETLTIDNFLGTFYSSSNQSAELAANPDTVVAYYPKGTNDMQMTMSDGITYDWSIVNDVSDYPNSEYYAAFSGGDNPFSYAHNPSITDGSSVCVIKDSYGNAFIPWLVDHYEHIYWLDMRYTSNTISQMVEDYGVQDVIIEQHIYNGTSDGVIDLIGAIGT